MDLKCKNLTVEIKIENPSLHYKGGTTTSNTLEARGERNMIGNKPLFVLLLENVGAPGVAEAVERDIYAFTSAVITFSSSYDHCVPTLTHMATVTVGMENEERPGPAPAGYLLKHLWKKPGNLSIYILASNILNGAWSWGSFLTKRVQQHFRNPPSVVFDLPQAIAPGSQERNSSSDRIQTRYLHRESKTPCHLHHRGAVGDYCWPEHLIRNRVRLTYYMG